MTTTIDALAATLGLETKISEWTRGEELIGSIESRLKSMAQRAALAQIDFDALGKKVGIAVAPAKVKAEPSVTEDATKSAASRLRAMQVEGKLAATDVNKAIATIGLPGAPGLPADKTPARNVEAQGVAISSTLKRLAVGVAAVFAVQGITQTSKATLDFASNLVNLSERTGMTLTTLQELDRAAKESSTSLESLVGTAQGLASSLEQAEKKGTGNFFKGLREIGLTAKELKRTIKDEGTDAALQLVADKVKAIDDAAKKATAVRHLGIDPSLIPALNSLSEARDDAHNLGLVLTDEEILGLKKLGDDVERAQAAFAGFKDRALARLAPALNQIVEETIKWLQANQKIIESAFLSVAESLVAVIKQLVNVVALLAQGFEFLRENSDLVVAALAGYVGALVIARVQAILTAASARAAAAGMTTLAFSARAAGIAIKSAMVSTGIGLVITALVLMIEHWDEVKAVIADAGEAVADFFTETIPAAIDEFLNLPGVAQVRSFFEFLSNFGASAGRGIFDITHGNLTPDLDQVVRSDGVPASPTGTASSSSSSASVTVGTLQVVSNSADPKLVADAIKPSLQDLMDEQIRRARKK